MENELMNNSPHNYLHKYPVVDPASFYISPETFSQSVCDNHNFSGDSALSTMQEVAFNSIYFANENGLACSSLSAFPNSLHLNAGMHEQLRSALPSSSTTDFSHRATPLQEQFAPVNNYSSLPFPSGDLRAPTSDNLRLQDCLHFSEPAKNPREYPQFLDHSQPPTSKRIATDHPSYDVRESPKDSCNFKRPLWNFSYSYGNARSRDLSLSLSTCEHPNVPDQCSEVRCSRTSMATLDTSGLPEFQSSDPAFDNSSIDNLTPQSRVPISKELSLQYGSSSQAACSSNVLLGSRYLHAAHQILAEIATCVFSDLSTVEGSFGRGDHDTNMPFSSSSSSVQKARSSASNKHLVLGREIEHQDHLNSQRCQEAENMRTELLTMLQLVDGKYSHCLETVQNVISAFHQATDSGTHNIPLRFTLHSLSGLYKSLRERIASTILTVAKRCCSEEKAKSFDSSVIEKQWSLQQARKNDQNCWRPQRGLPERSVSVLRHWMFQNFLHPYPNDNEKQFLAIKSGLTRSQVSNWFINARVRLWKPMIEEMYELSKKNNVQV